jgi:sugar phosphate isomerase/epimerase
MTRRHLLGTVTAASAALAQRQRPKTWRPKLGVLTKFSEANIEFIRQEGFTCIQLSADPSLQSDEQIAKVKAVMAKSGLTISSLGSTVNHTAPDPEARRKVNDGFARTIELAGKLGVRYIGTASGNMPGKRLDEQVSEIVRVYTEKYFALCEKYNVKILWEPWAGGPNVATGPVGYEALFKAFDNSPHVGLQYDPSHLLWQMMDPIQCARDFIDKIYDVHLKDTEILWPVVRKAGIQPVNRAQWWRFRLPGFGDVDWKGFFNVLAAAGYEGGMNIEHEDPFYGWPPPGGEFNEEVKAGLRVSHQFLKQFVPA